MPEAPSAVSTPFYNKVPLELSEKRIEEIKNDFKKAAQRAVIAGFDAIQIHAAHGYLISQFLSPVSNKRKDKYGGSIENRMRFLVEVYEMIREVTGKDFPIFLKINCEDFLENGFSFEESLFTVKTLESIGLDAVEISGGMRGADRTPILTGIDSPEKEGFWKDYSKKFKENLKIPVILVGGLRSFEVVEYLFKNKYCDLFSLSRPLIKEPDLIKKWSSGVRDKSECISCNKCFIPAYKGKGIQCVVRI